MDRNRGMEPARCAPVRHILRSTLLPPVCLMAALLPGGCQDVRDVFDRATRNITSAFGKATRSDDTAAQARRTAANAQQPAARPPELDRMAPVQIEAGLRELMRLSHDRSVARLGTQDGFYLSPDYRVRLPPGLLEIREALASVGLAQVADDLEIRLNRAAEIAAVDLQPLVRRKIAAVPIGDGRAIAGGLPDAATRHLEFNSAVSLLEEARPAVSGALARAGALQMHEATIDLYRRTFPHQPVPAVELTDHLVQATIGGLLIEMGRQEEAIRDTPSDRPSVLMTRLLGGTG